jgi:hypothetical protein
MLAGSGGERNSEARGGRGRRAEASACAETWSHGRHVCTRGGSSLFRGKSARAAAGHHSADSTGPRMRQLLLSRRGAPRCRAAGGPTRWRIMGALGSHGRRPPYFALAARETVAIGACRAPLRPPARARCCRGRRDVPDCAGYRVQTEKNHQHRRRHSGRACSVVDGASSQTRNRKQMEKEKE